MNKINTLAKIFLASICAISMVSAHVILDYPEGGETYYIGDVVTIQWHNQIQHQQENWDILYSQNSGASWENLVMDLPITQFSYSWTISQDPTSLARIKIVQDNVERDYDAWSGNFIILADPTAIEGSTTMAENFRLQQNYPNPFNPLTTISYSLPEAGEVQLLIYDVRGHWVKTLKSGVQSSGNHSVQWEGLNHLGHSVSTGVYFCRLQSGSHSQTIKMVYLP